MLHSVMRANHARSRTIPITYPSCSITFGESAVQNDAIGPSRQIALPHELGSYRGKADIAFRRITPPGLWVHGLDFGRRIRTRLSDAGSLSQRPRHPETNVIMAGIGVGLCPRGRS